MLSLKFNARVMFGLFANFQSLTTMSRIITNTTSFKHFTYILNFCNHFFILNELKVVLF